MDEGVAEAPVDQPVDGGGSTEELFDEPTPVEAERDQYRDALQRLQADFENYKKRVARTHADEVARAVGDLVGKLLAVVDTLDMAQAHLATSEDAHAEAAALVATRAQLLEVLSKEGLERVADVDVAFDPTVHDAVLHGPGEDGQEGTLVEEVLRAGYRWRGQVLRPAMCKVKG
jgi:molecular chaperone GrpE